MGRWLIDAVCIYAVLSVICAVWLVYLGLNAKDGDED